MSIPNTSQVKPRPVWKRHLRRAWSNVTPFPAPTEREKQDAIRVLEDPDNEIIPGLWEEAHRILDESGK